MQKLAAFKTENEKFLTLNNYDYNAILNSNIVILKSIVFEVRGDNYEQKRNSLRELAIDFFNLDLDGSPVDFSYNEISIISNWFEKMAGRLGLLKEFKENGIV